MAHSEIRRCFDGKMRSVMVLDDTDCYSRVWEMKQYGIGKGHKGGIWRQFPDVDWDEDEGCVIEQLKAIDRGESEMPEPGWTEKRVLVKL